MIYGNRREHLDISRKVLEVLLGVIILLFTASCGQGDIQPPIQPNDAVNAQELFHIEDIPTGPASGYQYYVWKLSGNTNDIAKITAKGFVRGRLYWHSPEANELRQALHVLGREPDYTKVQPLIADILADPDLRFAWEACDLSDGPPWAAIWICSPTQRKMAYLHEL
jgi:hypothetical protein